MTFYDVWGKKSFHKYNTISGFTTNTVMSGKHFIQAMFGSFLPPINVTKNKKATIFWLTFKMSIILLWDQTRTAHSFI